MHGATQKEAEMWQPKVERGTKSTMTTTRIESEGHGSGSAIGNQPSLCGFNREDWQWHHQNKIQSAAELKYYKTKLNGGG